MSNISELMSFVVENRANALSARAVAEIFDQLYWILSDNGGGIETVRESWLLGEDQFKVENCPGHGGHISMCDSGGNG